MTNQPNYSRWLIKYHDNLLKVGLTHPSIEKFMKDGYLGIKRTDKSFSRQPTDLVLEQTINADAGKRLTGVIQFTHSISARQRWARSHDIRTTIISHTLDITGLRRKNDVSADLEEHAIKRDSAQLWKFINTFEKFLNPFMLDLNKDCLYNIGNGTVASIAVQDDLLNFIESGERLKENFITECSQNGKRFEERIAQVKIMNFASEKKKKKIKVGDKVHEIRVQRDFFGRLLALSIQHNIDLEKTLSYPITTVPLSLCHEDGTIHKTQKSAMVEILKANVNCEDVPRRFDVVIFDGFFLLHTFKNIPKTFGGISKKIMSLLTATHASRVDIIFDQYFSPSIKDYERAKRQEVRTINYFITGPEQIRPVDFMKELRNIQFKEAFVDFLITHWSTNEMIEFIGNTTVNLNYKQCHTYSVHNNSVIVDINDDLSCQHHEEADTKIIYHTCQMDEDVSDVLIKTCDTDILILLLGNMDHLHNNNLKIYMEYGTNNCKKSINISELYTKLGPSICQSLPGFHALTGCDFNPSFRKEEVKKKPFQILQKSSVYQKAFKELGNAEIVQKKEKIFPILEKFVCQMYGLKSSKLNNSRYEKFLATYNTKKVGNTVPSSIYDILLQEPADTATTQSTETEECISDEENIVEESDDDENSDSEISDDAEENEC
ncbi:hypothetical protein ACJJTC_007650 [Scirpophaga incertulas]